MSLFTPIFPQTTVPPRQPPLSSSSSSASADVRPAMPYSSVLSRLHLSLASLPEELCPPSRPSSPHARKRSDALRTEIETRVQKGAYLGDLIRLRCTQRRRVVVAPVATRSEATIASDVPPILPETEEGWFAWEKEAERRRAAQTNEPNGGNDRPLLKPTASQSAREKVKNWQAGLPATAQPPEMADLEPRDVDERPSLGFPVVKRSTMLANNKDGKPKGRPAVNNDSTSSKTSNNGMQGSRSEKSRRGDEVGNTDVGIHQPHTKDVIRVTSSGLDGANDPPRSLAAQEKLAELSDPSTFLPPSFPSDLLTSTPQPPKVCDQAAVVFTSNLTAQRQPESNRTDLAGTEPPQPPSRSQDPVSQSTSIPQAFVSTPPSPPASTSSSQLSPLTKLRHTSVRTAPAGNPSANLFLLDSPPSSPMRETNATPLTPPSDDRSEMRPPPQTPHTPERPLKKARTTPDVMIVDPPSTPSSLKTQSPYGRVELGNAKRLPFPRTPDRHTLTTLLATSRRSKPRPRPPPRKLQTALGTSSAPIEIPAEDPPGQRPADPSPAKSYLSSPASGSSMSTPGSTRHAPFVPSSPLPQFSQQPGRFAPAAESTQAPLARGMRFPYDVSFSFGLGGRAGVGSASPGLARASSGLLGMVYSSQFDVDGQVDQLSNFMEKDVDFDIDAWVKNDDDIDEIQVEKLTAPSLSQSTSQR